MTPDKAEAVRRRRMAGDAYYKAAEAKTKGDRDSLVQMLTGKSPPSVHTVGGAMFVAMTLRQVIAVWHGEEAADTIMRYDGKVSSATIDHLRNAGLLLERFDKMPEPNVQQLARELAAENENLPEKKRWARGTTNPMVMDKYIRRLLWAREDRVKNPRRRGAGPAATVNCDVKD